MITIEPRIRIFGQSRILITGIIYVNIFQRYLTLAWWRQCRVSWWLSWLPAAPSAPRWPTRDLMTRWPSSSGSQRLSRTKRNTSWSCRYAYIHPNLSMWDAQDQLTFIAGSYINTYQLPIMIILNRSVLNRLFIRLKHLRIIEN